MHIGKWRFCKVGRTAEDRYAREALIFKFGKLFQDAGMKNTSDNEPVHIVLEAFVTCGKKLSVRHEETQVHSEPLAGKLSGDTAQEFF